MIVIDARPVLEIVYGNIWGDFTVTAGDVLCGYTIPPLDHELLASTQARIDHSIARQALRGIGVRLLGLFDKNEQGAKDGA